MEAAAQLKCELLALKTKERYFKNRLERARFKRRKAQLRRDYSMVSVAFGAAAPASSGAEAEVADNALLETFLLFRCSSSSSSSRRRVV